MGLLSPDVCSPPSTTSLILSAPLKQGKLPGGGGNPSLLWPWALCLTLGPKWKNVHGTTKGWRCRRPLFPLSIGKTRRGALGSPFCSDYPSPRSLLKNHLLYAEVIDDTKTKSACPSHQSTPSDIMLCLRGQTYAHSHTNTLPTQSEIVYRDVTLKVQKSLGGVGGLL